MELSEIDDLEKEEEELKKARLSYYNLIPIMSDPEYDARLERLKQLKPESFEVEVVGAEVPKLSVWKKVEHKIPMGSLSKVNSEEKFREWAIEVIGNNDGPEAFLFTHKIDGSSMELVYEAGELVRCVTRGNGTIGENVTDNVSRIPNIPKSIVISSEEVTIRGEVVMLKQVFQEKYSENYANPRNTAAGKIRDKKTDGKDCVNLIFLAYTLVSATAPKTEEKCFRVLQKLEFQVPDYGIGSINDAVEWHKALAGHKREINSYEMDGTVIRINDIKAQEELGDLGMRPRGQIAYKFDPIMGITKVIDVKWQVGNSGRITPVASVEPIEVGGVTITSISLHNLAMFKELALFQGCRVLVSRRNDVIPYIEQNLDTKEAA